MTTLIDEDPADPSVHEPKAKTYTERVTAITVMPEGDPTFSEMATVVRIQDDGAGEFVVVDQSTRDGKGDICIDCNEWPTLRAAIDRMIAACRE